MKIAVWHNLPSGGGKRALYDHVKGLIQRGHTVESWCPSTADQTYLPLSELIREHILPLEVNRIPKGTFIGKVRASCFEVRQNLREMDAHCRQCADEINQGGFDILFANACMFFRVTAIARYVKIPKVLYLQEPCRWLYEAMPQLPWIATSTPKLFWLNPNYLASFTGDLIRVQGFRVQAREELLNAKSYDRILANSFFSRESILRAYGLDARVCYLGIDTRLFVNQHEQRDSTVIGIGAFVPEKNIEFIIEALSLVEGSRPRLIWIGNVGSPQYIEELRQMAQKRSVDFVPKVRIEDKELVALLNRSAAMVYAPRLEPFGFAPLEANACGLPVVAVAEGGVRETVVHGVNGLLVEHDAAAMAKAIERLIHDKELAAQLGGNGSAVIENKWSLKSAIDRLEHQLRLAIHDA